MDLLKKIYTQIPFQKQEIKKIVSGLRYTAVMLNNGNIGVCANLEKRFSFNLDDFNLGQLKFRILYQAYLNAKVNYSQTLKSGDILDFVDIKSIERIVMIGFFKPIYEKLLQLNKFPIFFDFRNIEGKADQNLMPDFLQRAQLVIISATTLYNNTLAEILKFSKGKNFLLGPSATFYPYLLDVGLDGIFGTVFKKFDSKILSIIENDGGTRDFQKFGLKKVFLKKLPKK